MYILLYIVINFRALMYESDTIRFDETIIELMNFNVIIDTYSMIRYFRKWKMSIMTICFNYGYIGLSHK